MFARFVRAGAIRVLLAARASNRDLLEDAFQLRLSLAPFPTAHKNRAQFLVCFIHSPFYLYLNWGQMEMVNQVATTVANTNQMFCFCTNTNL
jgi:hypothetical protein